MRRFYQPFNFVTKRALRERGFYKSMSVAISKSKAGIILFVVEKKWTPKTGQPDKCILTLSRSPCSSLIVDAVRRLPVKRLMPSILVVEPEIGVQ
jgi:hypothetical protein